MQRTRLDYWLRAKYANVYEVLVNTLPSPTPSGLIVRPLGLTVNGRDWSYTIRCENEDAYNALIAVLRRNRSMYLPKVTRRSGVFVRLLDPPNGESFTYNMAWHVLRAIAAIIMWVYIPVGQMTSFIYNILRVGFLRSFLSVAIVCVAVSLAGGARAEDLAASLLDSPNINMPASGVDDFPLPSNSVLSSAESDWASPRRYVVFRKVAVTSQQTLSVDCASEREIVALRTGDNIRLTSGNNTMDYRVFSESKTFVENALEKGVSAMLDSVKAVRVGGDRLESLVITERTLQITSTAFRREDVMVTYCRRNRSPAVNAEESLTHNK